MPKKKVVSQKNMDVGYVMGQLVKSPGWLVIKEYLEETKEEIEKGILENLHSHEVKYDEDDLRKLHRGLIVDLLAYPQSLIDDSDQQSSVEDADPYPYNENTES